MRILMILTVLFLLQGCDLKVESDSENETSSDNQINDNRLPFPPIDNYENLDESLKPPTLSLEN